MCVFLHSFYLLKLVGEEYCIIGYQRYKPSQLDYFSYYHIHYYSCHLTIARHIMIPSITATFNPTIPMIISRPEPLVYFPIFFCNIIYCNLKIIPRWMDYIVHIFTDIFLCLCSRMVDYGILVNARSWKQIKFGWYFW